MCQSWLGSWAFTRVLDALKCVGLTHLINFPAWLQFFFFFFLWACMTPFDSLEKKKADQLVLPIYKCRFKLGRPRTFFQRIWSLLWLYHLLCVNHIGHVSTIHHYFINHSGLLGQVNRVARCATMNSEKGLVST